MTRFVLVHGAWHGGWCWQALASELTAPGHQVSAPDLPGHGGDATPADQVDLAAYVARVTAVLGEGPPAVLVGHSLGGVSISAAAEGEPDQCVGLIYLCAMVPLSGDSANALGRMNRGSALIGATEPGPPGTVVVRDDGIVEAFYADCDAAQVADAKQRLKPQPLAPMSQAVQLTPDGYGRVPTAYVQCTEDRAIPLAAQRSFCERAGITRIATLNTSHSPFMSAPSALADALINLAVELASVRRA